MKEANETAVTLLLDNPHLTSYILNYLASTGFHEEISKALISFLLSTDNIYDWQEMWMFRYFFTAKEI
ncbi:MAG: hypothetical protein ACW99J_15815 [Candidatus Thorarchaeota archaeon]